MENNGKFTFKDGADKLENRFSGWLQGILLWHATNILYYIISFVALLNFYATSANGHPNKFIMTFQFEAQIGYAILFLTTLVLLWGYFAKSIHYVKIELINLLLKVGLLGIIVFLSGNYNVLSYKFASGLTFSLIGSIILFIALKRSDDAKATFIE